MSSTSQSSPQTSGVGILGKRKWVQISREDAIGVIKDSFSHFIKAEESIRDTMTKLLEDFNSCIKEKKTERDNIPVLCSSDEEHKYRDYLLEDVEKFVGLQHRLSLILSEVKESIDEKKESRASVGDDFAAEGPEYNDL